MKRVVARWFGAVGILVALCAAPATAQIPTPAPPEAPKDTLLVGDWISKTKVSLGLTQSAFSSNWTGDEVGSVAWLTVFDYLSDGQWKPSMRLTNSLTLAFGQTHQQRDDRSSWLAPQKSEDKIDYDGTLRFTLGRYVDPFVAVGLESQFYQRFGGETRVLNPLQFTESAGIAKSFYDTVSRNLLTRLGVAARQRYDYFAVAPLDRTTHDAGLEWRTVGRFATAEDKTVFKSELTVFQALFFSGEEAEFAVFGEDRWKTTDVRWENLLSNKLNRWMSLDLYFEYLFDEQLDKAGQFKQTMGVGVSVQL